MTKQITLEEILAELDRAREKFPSWPTDPIHAAAILGEEFGELQKALIQVAYEPGKATAEDVRAEAIQVAAMALRFCRSMHKYQIKPGEQHIASGPQFKIYHEPHFSQVLVDPLNELFFGAEEKFLKPKGTTCPK